MGPAHTVVCCQTAGPPALVKRPSLPPAPCHGSASQLPALHRGRTSGDQWTWSAHALILPVSFSTAAHPDRTLGPPDFPSQLGPASGQNYVEASSHSRKVLHYPLLLHLPSLASFPECGMHPRQAAPKGGGCDGDGFV